MSSHASDGYALVTFLWLAAILAATVAMFSTIAIFRHEDSEAIRAREVSYQLARSGLSLWMGHVRTDVIVSPSPGEDSDEDGSDEDDKVNTPENQKSGPWMLLGQLTRSKLNSIPDINDDSKNEKNGDTVDAFTDPWGWDSTIVENISMGDTVYLPSRRQTYQTGDLGYFKIISIVDESGVVASDTNNTDPALSTSEEININTASYRALRSIKISQGPEENAEYLSDRLAKAIIERRSGSSQSVSDPNGNGIIELSEEVYSDGKSNPFSNINPDACNYLQSIDPTFGRQNCLQLHRHAKTQSDGLFTVEIKAGTVDPDGNIIGRYYLKARIDRRGIDPEYSADGPLRIISIKES